MINLTLIKSYIGGALIGTLWLITSVYYPNSALFVYLLLMSFLIYFIFWPIERLLEHIKTKQGYPEEEY